MVFITWRHQNLNPISLLMNWKQVSNVIGLKKEKKPPSQAESFEKMRRRSLLWNTSGQIVQQFKNKMKLQKLVYGT